MQAAQAQERLRLKFRPYRRRFCQPLRTHHGLWSRREGIILRLENLENPERGGYGEIAPLPWFGTEGLEEAIAHCQALQSSPLSLGQFGPSGDAIPSAPGPATRFGLGSAALELAQQKDRGQPPPGSFETDQRSALETTLPICQLLPAGAAALQAVRSGPACANPTFKWKIGVDQPAVEQALLRQLCQTAPQGSKLRLDANGGLTPEQARTWLALCDELGDAIEFLEQPLPPEQFEAMQRLSAAYQTPLALDESVAGLDSLKHCYGQGWRGIFVVKGAIAGHPQALLDFCRDRNLDLVFSSVFETAIARRIVWQLAIQLHRGRPDPPRALGFGVDHWLEDDGFANASAEQIWQTLQPCGGS